LAFPDGLDGAGAATITPASLIGASFGATKAAPGAETSAPLAPKAGDSRKNENED
jgi:hypothetical protein